MLAKFQLHVLNTFEVTALQSRKINLYRKYRENKLQALTETDVTYEWSDAQTRNLHHRFCHEMENRLLGKLLLLLPCISPNKFEIHKEIIIDHEQLLRHNMN